MPSGNGMPANWLGMIHLDPATISLIICSILSVAVFFERLFRYLSFQIDTAAFMDRIRQMVKAGQFTEAAMFAGQTPGPVAAVVKAGILCRDRSSEEVKDAIERVRMRQAGVLDSRLPILGTIGATAPFMGLLGTVIGIMRAFHDISMAGQAGTRVVADGIAQALVATALGLAVAIVAVIAYNFFVSWASRITVEMDTAGSEMVHLLNPGDK